MALVEFKDVERTSYFLDDYSYELPKELIAQKPSDRRDESRLMVLYREKARWEHATFKDISRYLQEGDLLILNDTRVVRARIAARKPSGGKVELLVLDPFNDHLRSDLEGHECITSSSKPLRPGIKLFIEGAPEEEINIEVLQVYGAGRARIRFHGHERLLSLLERFGKVPLPPYIRRSNAELLERLDVERYQTVYASKPGAIAAPTAGFHFTKKLLCDLECMGISIARITLHVGYGTFSPIRSKDIRMHRIHSEWCRIDESCVRAIKEAKREGRRVIAVGTTVVRTLEWAANRPNGLKPCQGWCDHYIYPGYKFKVVDAMVTNFHLPQSTLILLVSAFVGKELILNAYQDAVHKRYRFFSYGDAMLIL